MSSYTMISFSYKYIRTRSEIRIWVQLHISAEGKRPDPSKIQTISEMPTPSDKANVHRLLGIINFLAPHLPDMHDYHCCSPKGTD